jgi:EAL domain-containing protein (putative c-di-GMP-specific phosphodiesterase class I)
MTKIHISDSYSREIKIKSKLKNSIINNELYLCYQPQINTLLNTVIGVEALLRWNNTELGNISPSEFIPIAEHSGYIVDIGNWVLDEALKTACIWKQKGYKFNTMSINVSPIQLKMTLI